MPRRGLSFFRLKRIQRGFTLTELLVAVFIVGIVAAAAISVFSVFIFHFEQTGELATAQQNGEMVLTILRNPVLHAGLALPASADLSNVFSPDLAFLAQFSDGAVTVRKGDLGSSTAGEKGNMLLVLYGIPSDVFALDSGDISPGDSMTMEMDDNVPNIMAYTTGISKTKNWVLFPTLGIPLLYEGPDTGNKIKVKLSGTKNGSGSVALYDELHFLRGMRVYIQNGNFMTEDLTLQAGQPRVENIAAVFFERKDTLLKVSVVAAGPKIHEDAVYGSWNAFTEAFPDLPDFAKATEFEDFGDTWKYHRLRVLSESWRVRN